MENEQEFEDHTHFEGDVDPQESDMDLSFLSMLPTTIVAKGITKYTMKVPKNKVLVDSDSHVSIYRWHRTREGTWTIQNNNKMNNNFKIVKLGGEGDAELVACIKTMCPEEISYFKIERDVIDKDEVIYDPETINAAEKRRVASNKLLDGFHRIEASKEVKIKKPTKGVSESVESRLEDIRSCKSKGNEHFKGSMYSHALKEYLKGINLSKTFPRRKAEEEKKPEVLEELDKLRKDLINNAVMAGFKAKELDKCKELFDKDIVFEMKDNSKYNRNLSEIWADQVQDECYLDVADPITYLEEYLQSDSIIETDRGIVEANLKKLKSFEKSYNVLGNLKHYSSRAEEFEREAKIAERIRQKRELEESTQA